MTVTEIKEISKSKVQIMIDNEFAFVLYKGELRSYHLKENQEISKEIYEELMSEVLPKRAKMRAMHLLKARAYTTKQLRDKLKDGGYPLQIIDEAITYVSSYGYLNDESYAEEYIEYHKETKSRTQMIQTLVRKGISMQIIDEVWEKCMGEEARNLEEEQILAWMKKKNFNPSEADFVEKQKFSVFLYRKGFQIDNIRSVLSLDITSI